MKQIKLVDYGNIAAPSATRRFSIVLLSVSGLFF